MALKHFELADDVEIPGRWFLKSPRDSHDSQLDPESFRVARPVKADVPLTISIRQLGTPLDWTFAAFDMPVASARATEILRNLTAQSLEIFPARVEGHEGDYAVINALNCFKCVDESNSEFLKWTKRDGRPDKIGHYRQISRLRIDPSLVADADIFRIDGWRIALIVSERIKEAFEAANITGVQYMPVD